MASSPLVLPAALLAQSSSPRSAITGRVIDEQRSPIKGAQVALRELDRFVETDDSGRFVFANLRAGSYHLVVRRIGYEVLSMRAYLAVDDTLTSPEIRMKPSATQLPTVEVRGRGATNPELVSFERRRAGGSGVFLTPEDLAKLFGTPLSTALKSRSLGLQRISFPTCGGAGTAIAGSGSAPIAALAPQIGPQCSMPAACYAQIWIDGVRIYSYGGGAPPPNIDKYQTSQIEAIEIYPRGGDTPAEFNSTGSACGTIVLWSRR